MEKLISGAMWHEERLLIGGELVPAEGNRTYETFNPATGEPLGPAADASVADARRAGAAASNGGPYTRMDRVEGD